MSCVSETSDTPLIDHLVMREFVSGPPSYRSIYERVVTESPVLGKVLEQFADLETVTDVDGDRRQVCARIHEACACDV